MLVNFSEKSIFFYFQAILTSAPLLVLNVATLVSVLRAEDDDNVIDIKLLTAHLTDGNI